MARMAKVSADIDTATRRVLEMEADATIDEATKKAVAAIKLGLTQAGKIRSSLIQIEKTIAGLSVDAMVELDANECAVLSYVDVR